MRSIQSLFPIWKFCPTPHQDPIRIALARWQRSHLALDNDPKNQKSKRRDSNEKRKEEDRSGIEEEKGMEDKGKEEEQKIGGR